MHNLNLIQPVNMGARLNQQLVAWWLHTPQWIGGTTVRDITGGGSDGVMSQDATDWFGPKGRPGGYASLHFDGVEGTSGDRVTIPHSSKLSMSSSFTISAWIYPTAHAAGSRWLGIMSKGGSGEGDGTDHNWLLMYENNVFGGGRAVSLLFEDSSGSNQVCRHVTTLTLDTWHHYVGVFNDDTNEMLIYLNGNEVGNTTSITAAPNENTVPVYLGRNRDGVSNLYHFNGHMDDWRLWNRPLTTSEVKAMHDDSRTGYKKTLNFVNQNSSFFTEGTSESAATSRKFSIFNSPFNARTFRSGIFK